MGDPFCGGGSSFHPLDLSKPSSGHGPLEANRFGRCFTYPKLTVGGPTSLPCSPVVLGLAAGLGYEGWARLLRTWLPGSKLAFVLSSLG